MASTYTPATEPEKVAAESHIEKAAPPPPEVRASAKKDHFALAEVVLRFLVFASAVVAVVVMVTSKQTELVPVPFRPGLVVPRAAKFNHSPAFIYFVAAWSVAGFYSIITTLLSFYNAVLKRGCCPNVISHFVVLDVLLLGIVAAATGSAGGVAYIGLKGNKYVMWTKICNRYDKFCRHIGGSLAVSLFGSIVLALLVLLSIYSLSKKIPKHNRPY